MFKLLVGIAILIVAAIAYASTQHPSSALPTPVVAQAPAPTAASGQVRLELTQQTLTDQLNQRLDGQPMGTTPLGAATLTHITAQLNNGQMLTTGDAQVGSVSVPVSVTSTMQVQDERVLVVVQDASVAGVPLPAAARQSVQQAIQDQVNQAVDNSHARVTSVTMADGKLVVVGTPETQ